MDSKKDAILRLILHELRVDYNEEFMIKGYDNTLFRITKEDLEMYSKELNKLYGVNSWRVADMKVLKTLIFDGAPVVHLPFVPKHGEEFYTYKDGILKPWGIKGEIFEGTIDQVLRVNNGFVFKSKEAALAMRPHKEKDFEAMMCNLIAHQNKRSEIIAD